MFFKDIALKIVMIMPSLLLRKPVSKCNQRNTQSVSIDKWDEGEPYNKFYLLLKSRKHQNNSHEYFLNLCFKRRLMLL